MTTYTTLPNSAVQAGGRPRGSTVTALRDNPIAIAEGDNSAPVNVGCWHPHNKVIGGDANDGKFYDFAVNGAQASVETPDFADGWEYRIRLVGVSVVTALSWTLELYRQGGGAYSGTYTLPAFAATNHVASGHIELLTVRQSQAMHPVRILLAMGAGATNQMLTPTVVQAAQELTSAQRILRARLSAGGTFDAGQMFLDRRRVYF